MSEAISNKLKDKQFFGHPAGLFVLFFAEMWERMSYYGMRALLTLYMIKYLMADPEKMARVLGFDTLKFILETGYGTLDIQPFASQIYGLYTGFVYLSPYFGGILADRVWGRRKSVYVGGFLMAIGHFLMAFENLFLPALFFLILGNGAFKPNISTQVGALYPEGDSRRDGAFTIFYMGINLGAFFSPFLCKNLAVALCNSMGWTDPGLPWHIGFGLAGFGMLLGILVYHFGKGLLPKENLSHLLPEQERTKFTFKTVGGLLGAMALFLLILMIPIYLKLVLIAAAIAGIVWGVKQISGEMDRKRVAALVTLCVGTIFFWAIFEQQGNTLQLWADEKANWNQLGLQAENYQSFNPMFIFIFAPLLDMWWNFWSARGKKSSSVRKMAIGCFLIGMAFLIIPLASNFITVEKSIINLSWLALVTLVVTLGELYLSPIGLSFVTKLAPARFMSMMMGMWLMSSFIGNYLAGVLGMLYGKMSQNSFFMVFAGLGVFIGIFFLIAESKLKHIVGEDV